jgi:hypothetical protein
MANESAENREQIPTTYEAAGIKERLSRTSLKSKEWRGLLAKLPVNCLRPRLICARESQQFEQAHGCSSRPVWRQPISSARRA